VNLTLIEKYDLKRQATGRSQKKGETTYLWTLYEKLQEKSAFTDGEGMKQTGVRFQKYQGKRKLGKKEATSLRELERAEHDPLGGGVRVRAQKEKNPENN